MIVILHQTIKRLEKRPIGIFEGTLGDAKTWCDDHSIPDRESYFAVEVPILPLA